MTDQERHPVQICAEYCIRCQDRVELVLERGPGVTVWKCNRCNCVLDIMYDEDIDS